jgi:hypothetical protein
MMLSYSLPCLLGLPLLGVVAIALGACSPNGFVGFRSELRSCVSRFWGGVAPRGNIVWA